MGRIRRGLTASDVRSIFSAIGVAEGEVGPEYGPLKDKLYRLYPSVKSEHEQRARLFKLEGERQTKARKAVADGAASSLDRSKPLLPQIRAYYPGHEKEIRAGYSDEICLAADIWRYHPELVPQLASELRGYYPSEPKVFIKEPSEPDKEQWHNLSRLLERDDDLRRAAARGG